LEPLAEVGLVEREQDLERDLAPELLVARAIDGAHAALAEERLDAIAAEQLTRCRIARDLARVHRRVERGEPGEVLLAQEVGEAERAALGQAARELGEPAPGALGVEAPLGHELLREGDVLGRRRATRRHGALPSPDLRTPPPAGFKVAP